MVEDLASLSTQNEALTAEVKTIPQLKERLQVSWPGRRAQFSVEVVIHVPSAWLVVSR